MKLRIGLVVVALACPVLVGCGADPDAPTIQPGAPTPAVAPAGDTPPPAPAQKGGRADRTPPAQGVLAEP